MVEEKKKHNPKAKNVDGIFAFADKNSTLTQALNEKMAGDPTKWDLYKKNWKEYMSQYRDNENWYSRYKRERG